MIERLVKLILTPVVGEYDADGNLRNERILPQQVLYYPFDFQSLVIGQEAPANDRKPALAPEGRR